MDFTKECLDIPVISEISEVQVVRTMNTTATIRDYPKFIFYDAAGIKVKGFDIKIRTILSSKTTEAVYR